MFVLRGKITFECFVLNFVAHGTTCLPGSEVGAMTGGRVGRRLLGISL